MKAFARSLAAPGPTVLNPSQRSRAGLVELVVRADDRPRRRAGPVRTIRPPRFDGARCRHRADGAGDDAGAPHQRRGLDPRGPDSGHRRGVRHHHRRRHRGEGRRAHRRGEAGCLYEARRTTRRSDPGVHGPALDTQDRGPDGGGPRVRLERLRGVSSGPPGRGHETDGQVAVGNGLVRIEVDGADGTFALDGTPGYGRLVDGGDLGDSYNYSPPRQDSLVDTPQAVTVRIDERGPVRARVRITARTTGPTTWTAPRGAGRRTPGRCAHRPGGPGR